MPRICGLDVQTQPAARSLASMLCIAGGCQASLSVLLYCCTTQRSHIRSVTWRHTTPSLTPPPLKCSSSNVSPNLSDGAATVPRSSSDNLLRKLSRKVRPLSCRQGKHSAEQCCSDGVRRSLKACETSTILGSLTKSKPTWAAILLSNVWVHTERPLLHMQLFLEVSS